jgi:hypothetical protein
MGLVKFDAYVNKNEYTGRDYISVTCSAMLYGHF